MVISSVKLSVRWESNRGKQRDGPETKEQEPIEDVEVIEVEFVEVSAWQR